MIKRFQLVHGGVAFLKRLGTMLHCTLLYCKWQNELLSTCNTIETIRGTTWPLPRENPVKEMWQCPKLPNAKRQAHGTHEWTEAGIKTAKQLWQKILIYVTDNTDKIDLLKIYLYLRAVAIPVPTAYPIHTWAQIQSRHHFHFTAEGLFLSWLELSLICTQIIS